MDYPIHSVPTISVGNYTMFSYYADCNWAYSYFIEMNEVTLYNTNHNLGVI